MVRIKSSLGCCFAAAQLAGAPTGAAEHVEKPTWKAGAKGL
jgi:hypothetical protein